MTGVLGLDIGGANLKAAHTAGPARSVPFALWKDPAGLTDRLRALLAEFPTPDRLAVTEPVVKVLKLVLVLLRVINPQMMQDGRAQVGRRDGLVRDVTPVARRRARLGLSHRRSHLLQPAGLA